MADATNEQTTDQPTQQNTEEVRSDFMSRAEAQKAFKARDEAKARVRELETKLQHIEREREEREAKAEEERLKAAGQWDSLRAQLVEKQTKELAASEAKLQVERNRRIQRSVDAAFGSLTSGAHDYFSGNDGSKTVYDVWTAQRAFGSFVQVEDTEDGSEVVIVKNPKGETILGADGNPAPFAEAIGELIKLLPNRDRILRGSGKTGSGSSGGSTGSHQPVDLRNLSPAQLRDPKVIEALKGVRGTTGIRMGTAFD